MKNFPLLTLFLITLGSCLVTPVLAQDDLIYVPVDPCRIVDTRSGGGAITANTVRNFLVSGSLGELAVQGGQTDCLDPKAGTGQKPLAISAYVVAVPASGSTNGVLTAYPSHRLPPPVGAGSTVNFAPGQVIGNTTNITLCDQVSCPTDGEFAILARNTNQHVVIDVQGYFYPSTTVKQPVAVDASGNILGDIYGFETPEIAYVLTPQGYFAAITSYGSFYLGDATIGFTDTDCGISGGQAYVYNDIIYSGYVLPDRFKSDPLAPRYFYIPKSTTLVNGIQIQSSQDRSACLSTNMVLQEAQEVFPNDPAITGIPNTPLSTPISFEIR